MNPLQKLLDDLIDGAPEADKGAIALQLQIGGQPYAGSVMRAKDHDGLYEMVVVDPQQRLAVSVFFLPSSLSAIFVPKPEQQVSRSGLIIPGAH